MVPLQHMVCMVPVLHRLVAVAASVAYVASVADVAIVADGAPVQPVYMAMEGDRSESAQADPHHQADDSHFLMKLDQVKRFCESRI